MHKVYLFFILWVFVAGETGRAQTFDDFINQSFDCLDKENYVCAEEALKNAMRKEPGNPRNPLLLSNLGTIQRKLGKKEDALLSYTAALSSFNQKNNTILLMNRAALYAEMDSIYPALSDYMRVLEVEPDNEQALYSAGLIYIEKNDTSSARICFTKILKKDPRSIDGRAGYAMLSKISNDYRTAEMLFSEILKEKPDLFFLYLQRAEVYFASEKPSKALDDVNTYLKQYPDDEYAYFLRGKIKLALWETAGAYEDFQRAKLLGYDTEKINEMLRKLKVKG
ncbi:MAG: tetratricopeptide repeat protein [Candidatus Azobacteroides sp.]|nr:tetratricopeptide repeat protein [Candidatus Azobacteroides sp.]